ncbi:hypothetical protein L5515_002925 [Caenorhabditis briggsae]|uniref:DNA-directed RNA polymerase III subunit RPC5 n=1 Tax=Caenorhabditis briggsae TaxID=6238 RepID=A0AAE9EJ27_CAEBR|nr:hypothetical protein L3Y34_000039 [Caenorhabditis briggsae]UMM21101.1 hypothetical protein L5515_002925 [Caenorhabditis briggsae]
MEVDGASDDEEFPIRRTVKKPEFLSDEEEEEDQVVWERNVAVCTSVPNTEMFCVSYPSSKRDAWDAKKFPVARYKKNVRLLEMRFLADTSVGSYDKKKAELMYSGGADSGKGGHKSGVEAIRANDEVYEGRAFIHDHPIVNAVGFMKNGEFFLHPLTGSFEMHRSIHALNKKKKSGKGGSDEDSSEEEDEPDPKKAGTSSAIRVKFSRPETERQKKRREASALHREKKIASDLWIPMKVHLKDDESVGRKKEMISSNSVKTEGGGAETLPPPDMSIKELVNRAIICGLKEELVIEAGKEHMLSKQRIDELSSPEMKLKAHMVKSHVMKTSEMRKLIDSSLMSTDALIQNLKACSRLVNGVWVLDSNLMFQNLPPAHSNVAGKTDLYRAELWRNARDLALCLIDGGHRVTRLSLMTCFKLSDKDADEILSTFGVKCEAARSWKLRIERDPEFLNDPSMQKHIISEKEKWIQTFNDLEKSFHVAPKTPTSKK